MPVDLIPVDGGYPWMGYPSVSFLFFFISAIVVFGYNIGNHCRSSMFYPKISLADLCVPFTGQHNNRDSCVNHHDCSDLGELLIIMLQSSAVDVLTQSSAMVW